MKYFLYFILLSALFTGCGFNPEKPVYDTVKNPDKFPKTALIVLDNIDSGRINDPDSIVDAFTSLLMAEESLFENKAWKEVVKKLGAKFRYQADKMIDKRLDNISKAAGYYRIASFARPADKKLSNKSKLFSAWKGEITDILIDDWKKLRHENLSAPQAKDIITHFKLFYFQDSLHSQFAQTYLTKELLIPIIRHREIMDSLSTPDKAFFVYLKIYHESFEYFLTRFIEPTISLIDVALVPLDSLNYRAEFYFLPGEKIEQELTIAFWVHTSDSLDLLQNKPSYLPLDFKPVKSTTHWTVNRINIASRTFSINEPFDSISIGFYYQNKGHIGYLSQENHTGNLLKLSIFENSSK